MNPEIRRHAWLDLSWQRLLIAPLVLAALAAIPLAALPQPAVALAWGALGLFVAVTIGWGTLRALASVTDEVRERTWDFQRMAATTPAALALGKVFGAPLFQWYVGSWCLALFVAAGLWAGLPQVASRVATLVAAAVLLHALAVALSAAGARLAIGARAWRGGAIVVLLALLQFAPVAILSGLGRDQGTFVRWWGWRLSVDSFTALSTALLAGWALLAAWRAMARELREPVHPWAWPAFAAFLALWWAGLSTPTADRPTAAQVLALAALVLVVGTYVGCTLEPPTRVVLARLLRAWRQAPAPWQQRVPAWALHGSLALALGALALLAGRDALALAALPIALLAVRDAAVVAMFGLLAPSRPPLGRAVFSIALADLLLPGLALALKQPALAQALFPLLGLFEATPSQALLAALVHAGLAAALLAWTVHRVRGAENTTGP